MSGCDERSSAFDWMDTRASERERRGLRRQLRPRSPDDPELDLASNDYLGLARHPEVAEAAVGAARSFGAGATGSRLVTGSTTLHGELERELAQFCGTEDALVFSSGYAANLGALTALAESGTSIVSDQYNHASLVDGCRLSKAEVHVVPHADPAAVRSALSERPDSRALVVSDAVFSTDGDLAPLGKLAAAARQRRAGLVIDDAHGLGVLGEGGRGAVAASGLTGDEDVVVTATLSKAFGAQGGVVLGPRRVVRHLIDTARSFIFDTGLAPSSTAAALAALRLLRRRPELADQARDAARELATRLSARGLSTSDPQAAVVSVLAPSPDEAVAWARRCRERGLLVGCFRPPSVPDGISRLRLTARADLAEQQLRDAVDVICASAPEHAPEPIDAP